MKYTHISTFLFVVIIFIHLKFAAIPAFSDENYLIKSEGALRIVSFNIRYGAGPLMDPKISSISQFLSSLDADIICLQEVDRSTIRSILINQPIKLKKDLFMEIAFG